VSEDIPNHDIRYVYESLGLPRPPGTDTRAEHLAWCKERAHAELDYEKKPELGFASMASDLNKHDETAGHPGIQLGLMRMMTGDLSTVEQMREFIDGFN